MMKQRYIHPRALACIAVLCGILCSCGGSYAMRTQLAATVPREMGIGVVVYDETAKGGGLLKGPSGPSAEHPLASIFSAYLIEKGFPVKTMDLDQLVPAKLQEDVLPPAEYTVHQDRSNQVGSAPNQGNLVKNDAAGHLADVSMLIDAIPEKWGVAHLLVVYKLGAYSYTARVVRLADRAVVFTFMFDGNLDGWNTMFGTPKSLPGNQEFTVDPKSPWYVYMQLAEKVTSLF